MLNWDDYNVSETQAAPAAPAQAQPEVVAAALDTMETAAPVEPVAASDMAKAAADAVANIDTAPGLEELEMGGNPNFGRRKSDDQLPSRLKSVGTFQVRLGVAEIPRWVRQPLDAARDQYDS